MVRFLQLLITFMRYNPFIIDLFSVFTADLSRSDCRFSIWSRIRGSVLLLWNNYIKGFITIFMPSFCLYFSWQISRTFYTEQKLVTKNETIWNFVYLALPSTNKGFMDILEQLIAAVTPLCKKVRKPLKILILFLTFFVTNNELFIYKPLCGRSQWDRGRM